MAPCWRAHFSLKALPKGHYWQYHEGFWVLELQLVPLIQSVNAVRNSLLQKRQRSGRTTLRREPFITVSIWCFERSLLWFYFTKLRWCRHNWQISLIFYAKRLISKLWSLTVIWRTGRGVYQAAGVHFVLEFDGANSHGLVSRPELKSGPKKELAKQQQALVVLSQLLMKLMTVMVKLMLII